MGKIKFSGFASKASRKGIFETTFRPFVSLGQGIETRLNAYGPLYVEKPLKYWSNLGESFIKAQNATTGAPMF